MLYLLTYNLFLLLLRVMMWLLAPWNRKARRWIRGRIGLLPLIRKTLKGESRPRIWMHCASLGEFEQGRPVLEALRSRYPGYCLILTFFSPSGYEVRKKYEGADHVFYLPADSPPNAHFFISQVKPVLVLWIKYDYWYYYLRILRDRGIPVMLLSGHFRPKQIFFRWFGGLHRKMLHCFRTIIVQNERSRELLEEIGLGERTWVGGDTRFDRVLQIAEDFVPIPAVERFCNGHPVIVAGSTWEEDAEELDHFANTHPGIRFIIAPHEVHEAEIRDTEKLFRHPIRFSLLNAADQNAAPNDPGSPAPNVLIIDNIGMLARLYRYATIAYIGGGFGESGIHNVLEAAVYGKPVVFGPVYDEYAEAIGLLEAGGAFSVENALELENLLNRLLENPGECRNSGEASAQFVRREQGATDRILSYIQENRLLTSL